MMIKRKCGTCRHFEDRGIAGSGWCTHPARQEIQFMVLVRKSELACRNFMDQALWEPADNPVDIADLPDTMIPDPSEIPGEYALDVSMEASNRARRSQPVNDHTDQITSIAIPVTPSRDADRPQRHVSFGADRMGGAAGDAGSDVRDAQRRRQEEQLRRQRVTPPAIPDAATLLERLSGAGSHEAIERESIVPESAGALSTRVDLPSEEPDDPLLIAHRRQVARPPLVPPASVNRQHDVITIRGSGDVSIKSSMPAKEPPLIVLPNNPELSEGGTEPFKIVGDASLEPQSGGDLLESRSQDTRAGTLTRADSPRRRPQAIERSHEHDRRGVEPDGRIPERVRSVQSAAPILLPLAVDPIDSREIATATLRCCGTCRDFVPENDGQRGRCRNAYALAQSRMVKSDELACRSSIGCWWLPRDELWLERADGSRSGRPDGFLGGLTHTLATDRSGVGAQRRGEL
jgi:hypothetical protein